MSASPIQEARRILDRMTKAVVSARLGKQQPKVVGRNVLESIHRFVQSVRTNLHLDRVRADCERDLQEEDIRLISGKAKVFQDLRLLRRDLESQLPFVVEREKGRGSDDGPHASLARFDAYMEGAGRAPAEIDEESTQLGSAVPAEILSVVLRRHVSEDRHLADGDPLQVMLDRVHDMRDRLLKLRRTQLVLRKVHPAAKWVNFVEIVRDCDPEIDSPAWNLEQAGREVRPFRHYVRFLHEPNSLETDDYSWLEVFAASAANDAITVSSEFHSRLGSKATARWLLDRYARRCRWLRLEELRKAVAAGPSRKKELLLTRDAAVFLFDQGLNVLTEQSLGQHRYDVIGGSLLLEGKISSDTAAPLVAVVKGLRQLQSYEVALRHEGLSLEPILVIFRLGGQSADLPGEYTIGNLRVAIVVVDLASSSESGSRAKASAHVTPDKITAAVARSVKRRRADRR